MQKYGQVAYEAFATSVNWQATDGVQLSRWEDLQEPRLQGAWEAAALAVVQRYAQDEQESGHMSRQVPMDQPLSKEDREYLHARGEHARVAQLDEQFPPEDGVADDGQEEPDRNYDQWTMAELEDEVKERNEAGANISLPPKHKKEHLVAALQADDASAL